MKNAKAILEANTQAVPSELSVVVVSVQTQAVLALFGAAPVGQAVQVSEMMTFAVSSHMQAVFSVFGAAPVGQA